MFATRYAFGLGALALLPALLGFLLKPAGATYLGIQTNLDDHMVYAAWMQQAMRGQWLFDNRFTTDAQPGITIHVYFLVLGWFAKIFGLVLTPLIARAIFTTLSVLQIQKLIERVVVDPVKQRYCLVLSTFGAGIGYLVWHQFGLTITRPAPGLLKEVLHDRLPIDVWQPEAFFSPSMLTNSLFMVSLFLILLFFNQVLAARDGWKPVPVGGLAIGLLMNIHSYDVLLVALVLVAMLATTSKADLPWIGRVATMFSGVIPAALWFAHVWQMDPVFQARAATPTHSPNFVLIFAGVLPLAAFAIFSSQSRLPRLAVFAVFCVVLVAFAGSHVGDLAWMGPAAWPGAFAIAIAFCWWLRAANPAVNLVGSWAAIALVAPYFPAAFQRKLSMGMAVPIGILAGIGAAELLLRSPANLRRILAKPAITICCLSSVLWIVRDLYYLRNNVSNTTVHKLYYSSDDARIFDYLREKASSRVVAIAPPGASTTTDTPDQFAEPAVPDLNPVISGLTGAYTIAGHWSETPGYASRRNESVRKFWSPEASTSDRLAYLAENRVDYIVFQPKLFPFLQPEMFGEQVAGGPNAVLIKVRAAR